MEVDGRSLGGIFRATFLLATVGTLQDTLGSVGHVEAIHHVVHIISTIKFVIIDVGGKDAAIFTKAAHDEVQVVSEGNRTAEGTVDKVDIDRVVGPIVTDGERTNMIPAEDTGSGSRKGSGRRSKGRLHLRGVVCGTAATTEGLKVATTITTIVVVIVVHGESIGRIVINDEVIKTSSTTNFISWGLILLGGTIGVVILGNVLAVIVIFVGLIVDEAIAILGGLGLAIVVIGLR